MSKYLRDFPSLQKDYTAQFGKADNLHDCEYRSIRLARSEINMAYRAAEQERWQQFDFIKGYEVKTSGSHPQADICDDLAGEYPKDFVFLGWHPNCMCYVVPIVMTEDEYWDYQDAKDEDPDAQPEGYITETPTAFNEYVGDNAERIEAAIERGTAPYWVRDNTEYINAAMEEETKSKALPMENKTEDVKAVVSDTLTKLGMETDAADIQIEDGYVKLTPEQGEVLANGNPITMEEKDIIYGAEWKSGYVASGNAFKINDSLRYKNGAVSPANAAINDLAERGITELDEKIIRTLDDVIARNKLDFPVRVERYIYPGKPLSTLFGTEFGTDDVPELVSKINALDKGATLGDGAFVSCSFDGKANVMNSRRAVKLIIDIPKGTNLYVTTNKKESELILGRSTRMRLKEKAYSFKDKDFYGGDDRLVLHCEVL